jgi:hypothetical protein
VERSIDARRRETDAAHNERARREMLRIDGARPLGENLEQADALIKAAFQLARGHAERRR